ncbi:GAF domain-containing protein [Actinoplanes sp. NPDC051346]|uniref:GAF domain-containing protein n=1 Tax=Actinoplanes sp. NPDC051346 TaxID=3155048 RepID=UPI0034176E4E
MSHELLSGTTEQHLLQSVVAVARHVYAAAASSIFMVSPDTGDLVFAAVAGAGEQSLVGRRFPAGTGIAGWVTMSCQTLIVDNVAETDHFARDAATSTGYLPSSIMAAPLIAGNTCIGVLEVLDRHATEPDRELDDLELLDLLATQAAVSLSLVRHRERRVETHEWGGLLARLSDLAVAQTPDPLAVELLSVCLHLLQRTTAEHSLAR